MSTTLFDDFERTNSSPRSGEEDSYTFLNRVDQPFWAEIRRVLEDWFSRYPDSEKGDLAGHFRSPIEGQHVSAWWELFLHETFLRLGFAIEIHPPLPDVETRPDFLLTRDQESFYLEASVVFSGIVDDDPKAPSWLTDAINEVEAPDFFVSISEVAAEGEDRLKVRQVVGPIQSWLNGLDADATIAKHEETGEFEEFWLDVRGWKVRFAAWPVSPDKRGKPDHRVLGSGQPISGFVNDISQLRSKLKGKAGRYGRPELPFVNAILCASSFLQDTDVAQALFGNEAYQFNPDSPNEGKMIRQRNGFWFYGNEPTNRRLSAALVVSQLHPWNFPREMPRLWLNPWADFPLDVELPFPTATANDQGLISFTDGTIDLAEHFGLAKDWPPGKPFPRS